MFRLLTAFLSAILFAPFLHAQCTNPIASFPYTEDFETTNGNWVPGGNSSQWAWGMPSKPVINRAASGLKCWITGTLTQSAYSNNQNSTLTSPCFDFSSLTSPYIRFMTFWETERKYDGASFEYSIDGGNSWTPLGNGSSNIVCSLNNWFNTSNITALASDGWSGNVQPTAPCSGGAGNGSGQWKQSQHTMSHLAGLNNVRFRFRFAAGSVCNAYDGFAIDDIWIGETPAVSADFSFSCGPNNQVTFQPSSSYCDGVYVWDFGDPASSNNTASQYKPTHAFSASGSYTVSLTVQRGASTLTATRQVNIASVNLNLVKPIDCNGDNDASLEAQVSPAGVYNYEWNTSPVQTSQTISGLGAGSYNVRVTSGNACPATGEITITEPPPLSVFLGNDSVLCNASSLTLDAGVFSAYRWRDGSGTRTFTATQSGSYWVQVMNNAGCIAADTIQLTIGCSGLYFPSAFTPNDDGTNDLFGALGSTGAIRDYKLKVYNRWGQLVFQTSDPLRKWDGRIDGKKQATGSFAWMAEYNVIGINERIRQQGAVTLIR